MYMKVTKPIARKMYRAGYEVLLLPCKVSESALDKNVKTFVQPVTIKVEESLDKINQFDRSVNSFEYYNCNSELGYYSHYYVSVDDYKTFKEDNSNGIKESSKTT